MIESNHIHSLLSTVQHRQDSSFIDRLYDFVVESSTKLKISAKLATESQFESLIRRLLVFENVDSKTTEKLTYLLAYLSVVGGFQRNFDEVLVNIFHWNYRHFRAKILNTNQVSLVVNIIAEILKLSRTSVQNVIKSNSDDCKPQKTKDFNERSYVQHYLTAKGESNCLSNIRNYMSQLSKILV